MLSLYRPPKDSGFSSEEEIVIAAGIPYLAKIKGQLAMVRHKKDTKIRAVTIKGAGSSSIKALDLTRPREAAVNFLGEAFGVRARTRSKSIDRSSASPTTDAGYSYVTPRPFTYSTPLPQQAFSTTPGFFPQPVLPQPAQYAVMQPHLALQDLEQLRFIDAHYRSINEGGPLKVNPATAGGQALDPNPATTVVKHTCGTCGRLRSKRYYADHPIKLGEIPVQEFCAKCQRDASSTSGSHSSVNGGGRNDFAKEKEKSKAHKRNRGAAKRGFSDNNSLASQESTPRQNNQSNKSMRESEHSRGRSTNQRSRHRRQKKNRTRTNSDGSVDDSTASPYQSSCEEIQDRGRSRLRERRYRTKMYERGNPLRYNEESYSRSHDNFSQDDGIPEQSSPCATFRDDVSEGYYTWSYESDPHRRQEDSSRSGRVPSRRRRPGVFYSQSEEHRSRASYAGMQGGYQVNEYDSEKFTPPPYSHHTHYYSDWSVTSTSQVASNDRQRKGPSQQPKGYRCNIHHDSKPGSSEDETCGTRSSTLSLHILPPAPTPPPRHSTWSHQRHQPSPDDEAHYSDSNDCRTPYQKAFGVGPAGVRGGRKYFSSDFAPGAPFYSVANRINRDMSGQINLTEVSQTKRVTFGNDPEF